MRDRDRTDDADTSSGPDHTLVGAYALDAVDALDASRVRFERHLAQCPDCREEVATLREAASTLAATFAATPPDRLRHDVLARVSRVRPLPPAPGPEPVTGTHRRAGRLVRGRGRGATLLGVAAVALLSVVLGVVGTRGAEDLSPSQQVLRAADARSTSVDLGGDGRATVVHSDDVNWSVIRTENMPAPPDRSVYQIWYERGGDAVSAGLMPVGEDQTVRLVGDARGADGAFVTVEPEGGSEQPTSEPIAEFDFGPASP